MQVYHSLTEWMQVRSKMPQHLSIGFIPTMGNLHMGHMSLVTASKSKDDYTVVSIFINKAQFNKKDDYSNYPRTLDADLQHLEDAGVDCCLLPSDQDIYHDGYAYQIHETMRSNILEGEFRPGHFSGVLTVVMKLFNIVRPNRAYFGEKDYQQLQLIKKMVSAFFMDIEVIGCPTIRTGSGLAHSSRNNLLSEEALVIANKFATILQKEGSCNNIISELTELGIEVEYVEDHDNRRLAAVNIGGVRLIDNLPINV